MRLALAALALLAAADEKKPAPAICPVDGAKFTAFEVLRTNEWGGVDADFCPHAYKTAPLDFHVWVCPSCAFAGRKKDFEAKLGEAEKKALAAGLKPLVPIRKGAAQGDIPGWVKYDLLAQATRIRGLPPVEVGRAYLHASWSARQQGAPYLDDFEEWEALRTSYGLNATPIQFGKKNRTPFELEVAGKIEKELAARPPAGINRTLTPYLAAYLYRKHGENAGAERLLGALAGLKGENSVVDEAAARMAESIPREAEFQRKAIEVYRTTLEGGALDRRTRAEVAYLLGELFRRTGDRAAAARWFDKALADTESPDLRKLAEQQKALLPP